MYCPNCGSNVGDNKYCPYCGTEVATNRNPNKSYTSQSKSKDYDSNGIASFVCGIIPLVVQIPVINFVLAIIAIVLGNQADKNDLFGKIGKILGWVSLGLSILTAIIIIWWCVYRFIFWSNFYDYSSEIYSVYSSAVSLI